MLIHYEGGVGERGREREARTTLPNSKKKNASIFEARQLKTKEEAN